MKQSSWHIACDHVQFSFEGLRGWKLYNLSGQPVPVFSQPHMVLVYEMLI